MDITKQNFVELLPEITDAIRQCDFVGIDTELSGLLRERSSNRFDLPSERYAKVVESSRGYFIMQFGLSCFTRLKRPGLRYSNRTYNFYIFPQAQECYGDMNRTFSLEVHAIQFLTEHGFDFNRLFKNGVSYLTFQEKKLLKAEIKREKKNLSRIEPVSPNNLPKFVPRVMKENCCDWLKQVSKFIERQRKHFNANNICGDHTSSSRNELEIKDCSTNHKRNILRRLLETSQMAENLEIKNKLDPNRNETILTVSFIDKAAKEDKQEKALTNAIGFFEVLEHVIVNKKPIVGHNLFLDLIQIMNQFIEPLSDDYNSFKETIHSLFPHIYDTKYVAHAILDPETLTRNQSKLEDLYVQLKDVETFPRIEIEHLGEFVDENQAPHQAGYDAYMSGYCFIALCESYLRQENGKEWENSIAEPLAITKNRLIVEEFANKVHLSYSYDFKCFDFGEDELEPEREHVFYVEHPETWVLDDLFSLFQPYGGVEASKLTRNSSLCALRNPKYTNSVIKNSKGSNYTIYTYETYILKYRNRRLDKRKTASPIASNDEDFQVNDVEFSCDA